MTALLFSRRRPALAALLAFGLALAAFALIQRGTGPISPSGSSPALRVDPRPAGSTEERIGRLQDAVRAAPERADLGAALASAYLQRARETGDPGYYTRAGALLERAAARDPRNAQVALGRATLALARHDFRGGLELAWRARALAPGALASYPAIVDALVELGRYRAAERELQRFVDAKPTLPAYARVSYLRELRGDLDGAAGAMARAVTAGAAAPENVAYVQTLLADLERARGNSAAAQHAYADALAALPGYVPAAAGRARLAAQRGDLTAAARLWRGVVARRPLPEYVIALGEVELAAGRGAAARRDLALVRAQQRLLRGAGVNVDVEFALFEADHGSAARAVELARRAWAAAPSVRSADALGWALARSGRPDEGLRWARRALRLGSLDPGFRFHAGMTAIAAGRSAEGRRHLALALRRGLTAFPWQAAGAKAALR
jgi:tetratricopeptide (TPR) repeat protein